MRALIVGSSGQDGRILSERLAGEGAAVEGVTRTSGPDILDRGQVAAAVARHEPTEIYYLAAFHHSSEENLAEDVPRLFDKSADVHLRGLVHVLDAVRAHAPRARVFYAASSHLFGAPRVSPQDESTPFEPRDVYGITKAAGVHACRLYREQHGVQVSVGILYNHESPYRDKKFVSQRIVRGAREALEARRAGRAARLQLGNLSAQVDWGWAPDTVDAMVRIVRHAEADDFVVATGELHSVGEFAQIAFGKLGLDWREHVEEVPALVKKPMGTLVGDAKKLRAATGWKPAVTFERMVESLLEGHR